MPSDVYNPFRSGDRPLPDVQRHVDVGLGFMPAGRGVLAYLQENQIACVHMSGLSVRSHMNAGQDGFRDKGSKQHYDLQKRPLGLSECPASWIDPCLSG
jgi:hypothetical protein